MHRMRKDAKCVKLRNFIGHAVLELIHAGVSVKFEHTKYVKVDRTDKEPCEGYFSDSKKELVVATDYPIEQWGLVFLHEYCHVQQWTTKSKAWMAIETGQTSADVEISEWIAGKKLKKSLVKKYMRLIQRMELECEKMAVRLIRRHNLDVRIDDYIKGANAYVLFYNTFLTERKWYSTPPDKSIKLKSLMPSKFIKSLSKMTKEIEQAMKEECYKNERRTRA